MAEQICPNCKVETFNWQVDDDVSPLTIWDCRNCNYRAFENQSDERNCLNCNKKIESKLQDDKKEYWWCSNCNTVEIIGKAPNNGYNDHISLRTLRETTHSLIRYLSEKK